MIWWWSPTLPLGWVLEGVVAGDVVGVMACIGNGNQTLNIIWLGISQNVLQAKRRV